MQEATVNEAERLKEQAARARHYASMAAMEDDRSAWLAVAERWQRLADELKLAGGETAPPKKRLRGS